MHTATRTAWTLAFLVASCGFSDRSPESATEQWRDWFSRRQFGEDPYFFFPSNTAGPTGCPENRRLSYGGADTLRVQLTVIDERGAAPQIRARCTVRFDELLGAPTVQSLPDGRAMWALTARAAPRNP